MITTIYHVKNEKGQSVANMYGYHAIKNLVKDGKTFTAKNVIRSRSKQFKIAEFELTELKTELSKVKLVFGV